MWALPRLSFLRQLESKLRVRVGVRGEWKGGWVREGGRKKGRGGPSLKGAGPFQQRRILGTGQVGAKGGGAKVLGSLSGLRRDVSSGSLQVGSKASVPSALYLFSWPKRAGMCPCL